MKPWSIPLGNSSGYWLSISLRYCRYWAGSSTYSRYCASLAHGKQIGLLPMDGSPVSPPVLDCSPHSMEESGEPSPLFSGLHSTNHKIRWNQGKFESLKIQRFIQIQRSITYGSLQRQHITPVCIFHHYPCGYGCLQPLNCRRFRDAQARGNVGKGSVPPKALKRCNGCTHYWTEQYPCGGGMLCPIDARGFRKSPVSEWYRSRHDKYLSKSNLIF